MRCLKRNITREAYPLITCPGNDSGQMLRCQAAQGGQGPP